MEQRFGRGFGDVRIHTDDRATRSAESVDATAYTVANNVVFAKGRYQPAAHEGRRLLAHELTHVVQQRNSGPVVQRELTIDSRSEAEREADRIAGRVVDGQMSGQISQGDSGAINLQRQADAGTSDTGIADSGTTEAIPCSKVSGPSTAAGTPIRFEQGSAALSPDAVEEIDRFAQAWIDAGGRDDIDLDGFASREGTKDFNLTLSCERAEAVKARLVASGVSASSILTFAHGETGRFGTDLPPNRRVTMSLTPSSPLQNQHDFRVASVSFLACAPCNPFTDDGPAALSPPISEPSAGFRMKHVLDVSITTNDGIHVDSAFINSSSPTVGESGYCGVTSRGHIISRTVTGPTVIAAGPHGEGAQWESEFVTQVGATVPATLPLAPCGFLGTNTSIPAIHNRFRVRLFADGTKESEFVSASRFPFHYLYEDSSLKMSGGNPVSPTVDFAAWSTSTGVPAAAAEAGFKALRIACCSGGTFPGCFTVCSGGTSIPIPDPYNVGACAAVGASLLVKNCPSSCAPTGTPCSTLTRMSNP